MQEKMMLSNQLKYLMMMMMTRMMVMRQVDGDDEYDDDDNARSWSGGAQMAICPPPNSAPSITINFETAPEPPKCKRNFTPFDVFDATQYKQL